MPPIRVQHFRAEGNGRSTAWGRLLLLAAFLTLIASSAAAGQEGQVTGVVTDASTGGPLGEVQVFLEGTNIGTLSRADGRYLMLNVPAGTHQLRAERIGFSSSEQTVTVSAGGTVTANLSLEAQALGLDEIVVTGTAGQARRREIGNSLSRVEFDAGTQVGASLESALQAQAPGLNILGTSGTIGASSQIRLRGNVSVAMSNQPLIFVDGVRVAGEPYPSLHGRDFPEGRGAGTTSSPLNDINPQDIARVEVVKGPAATTLYGTEASAGVIQIFTKRGAQGTARWTADVSQGMGWVQPFAPAGMIYEDPPYERTSEYIYVDPWLSNGHWQKYALSVSGGQNNVSYFLSTSWEDNKGTLADDAEDRFNLRGNLDFNPLPGLNLQWNSAYTDHWTQRTPTSSNAQGLGINAYRLDANYLGDGRKDEVDKILEFENFETIKRFTTGVTARHTMGGLSNRLAVGYDLSNWEGRNVRRFGYILYSQGAVGVTQWQHEVLSIDYVGSYAFDLGSDLASTFSWGAQSVADDQASVEGWGEFFPGPGEPTVNSGATTQSWEERMRVVNAGFFFQNLFDLSNRYFVTVGLRVDGNSAFGEGFGLQPYPKASLSYVLSEESFWPDSWGDVRLRAAYGHAGRAPGAFDAVRTWEPASWAGESAFVPRNLGNPEIGPERSVEIEAGAEASVLDDRLTLDFTYYHQTTEDALFPVVNLPSEGNWPSQLRNVGKIKNEGVEVQLNADIFRRRNFGWDVGVSASTNYSEVLDLGGAPPFQVARAGWIYEGHPVTATWTSERVLNPEERAEPIISTELEDQIWGPEWPTLILQMSTGFQLPRGIVVDARAEYQRGGHVQDVTTNGAVSRGMRMWPICQEAYGLWDAGRDDEVKAIDRLKCSQANSSSRWGVYSADFLKLRNLSVTMPVGFAIPGSDSANLTLAMQNLRLWKAMPLLDPEMGGHTLGAASPSRLISMHTPGPVRLTASLRVDF